MYAIRFERTKYGIKRKHKMWGEKIGENWYETH